MSARMVSETFDSLWYFILMIYYGKAWIEKVKRMSWYSNVYKPGTINVIPCIIIIYSVIIQC